MASYTQPQLAQRNKIIKSHKCFGNFINSEIVNKLIYLFDENSNNYTNEKISKYIEEERKVQGLSNANITIKSEMYGETEDNPTLFVKIIKNNIEFIHLSIHLCIHGLKPESAGVIHIFKNVFKPPINKSISIPKFKKMKYALISVNQPKNKPKSLEFSIADGYTTPGIANAHLYNSEIQKEMDVIITVLNRLFDENDNKYYVGKRTNYYFIHNKTNTVLNKLNMYTALATRRNKGTKMISEGESNTPAMTIYYNKNKRKTRKKSNKYFSCRNE
jgi:hypothetical protein